MSSKSILATRENPEGHKLEELAYRLIEELHAENRRIEGDPSAAAQTLLQNNADIIVRLREIKRLQEHSLRTLETVGPDQGPTGTPRVGK